MESAKIVNTMQAKIPIIISGGDAEERLKRANDFAQKSGIPVGSPDYILIAPENSIGIEKLREILPIINLKPYQSPQKIVIIEDAQKLTIEAQNSFLKTLEEPPPNTIILLLVENPDQLLPTILSRCLIENLSFREKKDFEKIDILAIQKLPLGLKFKKAAEIAVSRESAQKWLKNAILTLHESVIESAEVIIKFQEALKKLDQNVNPRLVIENLFLNF